MRVLPRPKNHAGDVPCSYRACVLEHAFSHIPTVALRVMNAGVYKAHKCYNIESNGNQEEEKASERKGRR